MSLVDTASKNLDQTTAAQITPAQLKRMAATVRNTQVILSGKTPVEVQWGANQEISWTQFPLNPEQFTSTPTKQDLLNEETQKMAMKTHFE